ncbi:hypothetical protein Psta_0920 [Pirellula staleyi DSM 6068]|uniref:Uncharacterized protein n=1 Tax=Pirellula staleyi (strain ATCC 27377 / DSM 6068 / ICPB 4128) TaxID=530564 RepID=D2R7A9_PIRSD|nr:hypothetical protein Psta_0920 [Pirellula staleyi DSM 6068]
MLAIDDCWQKEHVPGSSCATTLRLGSKNSLTAQHTSPLGAGSLLLDFQLHTDFVVLELLGNCFSVRLPLFPITAT